MIKINLLGVAPPPTPGPTPSGPVTRTFQIGVLVGSAVVCFAVVAFIWWIWNAAVKEQQDRLKKEQRREAELKDIKTQNDRYIAHLKDLQQRIDTIETLRAGRVGPVEQMTALGDVVNRTTDVYLFNMTPQGERVVLNGQSNSVDSMAVFLKALQKSGYFQDVQLRRFFQDDQRDRLSYKFSVDMIYKSPTAAAAAQQPAAPPGAAAPAKRAGL